MFSLGVINDSRSIIDNSRVMPQLVASFTIIFYDHHIFIAQATVLPARAEGISWMSGH